MNEKMTFKIGAKLAVPLYMGKVYCIGLQKMCYNWTTNNVRIENINIRSGMKNDISRLIISTNYYHWKWAWIVQGIPTIWICFASKVVFQNGAVF